MSQRDLGYIEIPMTAFKAYLKTKKGIDLTEQPFSAHQNKISNKLSYEYSQAIGANMRDAAIEAFTYISARTKQPQKNVAAFTPDVFFMKNKQYITNMQNWRCVANQDSIELTRNEIQSRVHQVFAKSDFPELL